MVGNGGKWRDIAGNSGMVRETAGNYWNYMELNRPLIDLKVNMSALQVNRGPAYGLKEVLCGT